MSEADSFLSRIQHLDYQQMLDATGEELQEARRRPKAKQRDTSYPRYLEFLHGLQWFLQNGSRPSNFDDYDFEGLKTVAESLVKRGQLKDEVLVQFGQP